MSLDNVCENATCSFVNPTTGVAPELFTRALNFFTAAQCLLYENWPPESNVSDCEAFDFIIIGAGAAGCVLANRLTEIPGWKVLLIEAGGDPPIETILPSLRRSLLSTYVDWGYLTTYDGRTNQANINGSIGWSTGKMIGGSSSMFSMVHFRGNTFDYQQWYDAGNTEWHPNIVTQYFRKLESLQAPSLLADRQARQFYGLHGPLVVNLGNETRTSMNLKILNAWDELGFKIVPDLNVAGNLGSGFITSNTANGRRQSTATDYLNTIQRRPNLKILKNTFVTKILMDENNHVYGVEAIRRGKKVEFCAGLEVILSAGTLNSPKVMMLSGIGPKKQIRKHRIGLKKDSPMVGRNLQDHHVVIIPVFGKEPGPPTEAETNFEVIRYLYNQSGYYARSSNEQIVTFFSRNNLTHAEFEVYADVTPMNTSTIRNSLLYLRWNDTVVDSIVKPNANYAYYQFRLNYLHPYSRGNVTLRSAKPTDHPLIYPNYFIDQRDLDIMVEGIKIFTKIVNTTYFKSIDGYLGRLSWPACDVFELDSVEYWKCICINLVLTEYHPVGTCKMGPDPKTSVVDQYLRVHGVANLRVIDASVMPTIVGTNTHAPVVMIAERAADFIKNQYLSN